MGDVPGPSTAPYFNPRKATENFSRLCQLIMTICSDLFRDILSRHIKPADLRSELDNNKRRLERIMNVQQKELIYPVSGNTPTPLTAKDLDISNLYTILRNICNIPKHQMGWGNPPRTTDYCIAACIERIRIQRNEISAHIPIGEISDVQFEDSWKVIRNSIVEIERQLISGNMYERGVDELRCCDLNPSRSKQYVEQFKQIQDILQIKQEKFEDFGEALFLTKHHMAVKRARLDDVEEQQASTTTSLIDYLKEMETRMLKAMEKTAKDTETCILASIQGRFSKMEEKFEEKLSNIHRKRKQNKSRELVRKSAILTSTIVLPGTSFIDHIAYLKPGRLWISGTNGVKQIDLSGNVMDSVDDIYDIFAGTFAITDNGDILYIPSDKHRVMKKTTDGTTTVLSTPEHEIIRCIHSSLINGDILLGIHDKSTDTYKVARYNRTGEKIQDIELDDQGQRLYKDPLYITENRNGDIVTSDYNKDAVVVVDRTVRHRFDYTGRPSDKRFWPRGVCTDDLGHILVVDMSKRNIHVLDTDGKFLACFLLKNTGSLAYDSICVDDQHNLYMGCNGKIKVFKYLK